MTDRGVPAPYLHAEVAVQLGTFDLDVTIDAAVGETVALLGPNGAGKSTLLRCLAGLTPIDRGRIVLNGTVLEDSGAGVRMPPPDRAVGMVFQQHLLFPSMTATENVAFGLRSRGIPKAEARAQANALLALVGLGDRGGHRPHELSGGQSQRVALARALAIDPRMILLDEPLAALDVTTRSDIRRELRTQLDRRPDCVRIVVTHDPVDAFALADRAVVIEQGRVVQHGTLDELARRPRSAYVADLLGVNLYRGAAVGSTAGSTVEAVRPTVELEGGGRFVVPAIQDGEVFVAVRPNAVSVHLRPPDGSARNAWPGRVDALEPVGGRVRIHVAGTPSVVAEVTTDAVAELGLRAGADVWVSVKATEVDTYPA